MRRGRFPMLERKKRLRVGYKTAPDPSPNEYSEPGPRNVNGHLWHQLRLYIFRHVIK